MSVFSSIGKFIVPVNRQRESGMELLRIIAMSMILCGHFMSHGLDHTIRGTQFYHILEPFFICGVNLFFLISGWYGIRFSVKGAVKLIVLTFFFVVVNLFLCAAVGVEVTSQNIIDVFLFPISRSSYWFMMVYFALYILAPVLNAAIRSMDRKQFLSVVIMLTIFNCYSCSIGDNYVSQAGYTVMQAIWLYCVAACLRRYEYVFLRVRPSVYILIFILSTIINIFPHRYEYNSPLVVVPSVAFFLAFIHLRFRNTVVNSIASASLGAYLLQDGMFGHSFFYLQVIEKHYIHLKQTYLHGVSIRMVLFLLVIFILIWLASWLLTPLANALGRWLGTLVDSFNKWLKQSFARIPGFSRK